MSGKLLLVSLVFAALAGAGIGGAYAAGSRMGEERGRLEERKALQANFQQELLRAAAQVAAPTPSPAAGGPQGGQVTAPGVLPGGGRGGAGALAGGLTGTVKSVDANALVITTAAGDLRVALTAQTVVERASAASRGDIKTGATVTVAGARGEDGIAARTVTVHNQ